MESQFYTNKVVIYERMTLANESRQLLRLRTVITENS